LKLKLHTN